MNRLLPLLCTVEMFNKAYSVIDGLQALSTNSMQVDEVVKECLPVVCIATRFLIGKPSFCFSYVLLK